ncbi:MAG: ATP-binding cassette domain-containing protein [Rhodospirillales bacterium]|jgi:ATP-binding cassette, subfamily C, bacterial LapB|nr:ATP-binding cassette domain-containing protein [Rhodospirillales bacterium]
MKEMFRRLMSRPGIAAELVVASFLANMLALASPLFVIQVLNRYVSHGVDGTLITLTTGVILAVGLEFAFRQVRIALARGISVGPDEKMSAAGFAVLTGAKTAALERVPPGVSREVMSGLNAVETAYGAPNIGAVLDVPFAFLYIAVLFLLNPILAGVAALFLTGAFLVATISLMSLRKPTRAMVHASSGGNNLVGTAVQHADTVRAFNAGNFLNMAWVRQSQMVQGLRARIVNRQGFVQSLGQTSAALMNVAIIAVGATLVVKGEMTVGAMIGANILASRALVPLTRFAQLGEVFAKARQSLNLINEFARIPVEATTGSAKSKYTGSLEIRDLAFEFTGASSPLFESVSLDLTPGSVLLVTGGNSTGKTTLARLLAGVLEPTRGQILADGLDLRQSVPEWWRRQIMYMPQEPAFLNATIEENLRTTNPEIGMERLNELIDMVGLRQFLDETNKGFDEPVTSNGNSLSLGIRRRLALARALATGGQVAIFDEPMEGMDRDGCAAVSKVMGELARQGRTIIVISHDHSIVKGASVMLDLNAKPVPRITTSPRPVETNDVAGAS